jgi:hypothetical protein
MSWLQEKDFTVKLARNHFKDVENLIVYNNLSIFSLKKCENDGSLEINLDIYDKEGKKVATIKNSRIVDGDKKNYEINNSNNRYMILNKKNNKQICEIKRKSDSTLTEAELEVTLNLYTPNGFNLIATPTYINLPYMSSMVDNYIIGTKNAICVGQN